MVGLTDIVLSNRPADAAPLEGLDQTHGVTDRAARMYSRFFGQNQILLEPGTHKDMLLDGLRNLVRRHPELTELSGIAVYAKTQTHNTPAEQNWLREIFDQVGLERWDTSTFSMTNCASGLAAIHAFADQERPYLVLSGEKAFHSVGSRLSVGLLGEAVAVALFLPAGRWSVRNSWVRHLPKYFLNPDDMAQDDKASLQTEFEDGFKAFLQSCLDSDPDFFAKKPIIFPYNLNMPLLRRVLKELGLFDLVPDAIDGRFGHTFCSDTFLNLAVHDAPPGTPVFLFCAGMGVTFAAVALEAPAEDQTSISLSKNHQTKGKSNV